MRIKSYKKQGKTYYKFQIRLGDKVTTRSNFKTKNEAIFSYNQMLVDYEEKIDGNILYKEVYEEWLQIYKTKVKESTFQSTTKIYEHHILPVFGEVKIKDITSDMCQQFALSLVDFVKGRQHYSYAKKILSYAKIRELINKNPFDNVILPKFKESKKQINYLPPEDVRELLNYYKDDQYWYTLFRTMIYTGMRRGEILALHWEDINFKKSTISISKALSIGEGSRVYLSTTKTKKSIRKIEIDSETILELKKLKLMTNSPIVFPNKKGNYSRLSNIGDKLNKAIKDTEIKKVRVHDLRHTHASLLFASGADMKYVQERLGHENIETTMDVYIHVTEKTKKKALDNFIDYMKEERA